MNKKSFFIGLLSGVVLTFVGMFIIGLIIQNSEENNPSQNDAIKYFEKPVSYDNKSETSFQIFQVMGDAALANEESSTYDGDVMYMGNLVLLLGEDFYSDQIVTVKNPQCVGTYSYTTNAGMPKTVRVIDMSKK